MKVPITISEYTFQNNSCASSPNSSRWDQFDPKICINLYITYKHILKKLERALFQLHVGLFRLLISHFEAEVLMFSIHHHYLNDLFKGHHRLNYGYIVRNLYSLKRILLSRVKSRWSEYTFKYCISSSKSLWFYLIPQF